MISTVILPLSAAVWMGLAVYVARDASKRNKRTYFWLIFTMIFGLISLAIYTIQITPVTDTRTESRKTKDTDWKGDNQKDLRWEYSIIGNNSDGDLIVDVSDGEKQAKFVIQENKVSPYSSMYQNKYGEEWVEAAKYHLDKDAL